ncbi:hypothetical protein AVEN_218604-1, partial [Araneus ventricosus]
MLKQKELEQREFLVLKEGKAFWKDRTPPQVPVPDACVAPVPVDWTWDNSGKTAERDNSLT